MHNYPSVCLFGCSLDDLGLHHWSCAWSYDVVDHNNNNNNNNNNNMINNNINSNNDYGHHHPLPHWKCEWRIFLFFSGWQWPPPWQHPQLPPWATAHGVEMGCNEDGDDKMTMTADNNNNNININNNNNRWQQCLRTTIRTAPPTATMSNCSWGGNRVQWGWGQWEGTTPPPLTANVNRGFFVLFSVMTGPSLAPNTRGGHSYCVYINLV